MGLGADHQMFAENQAKLWGIDLLRAINLTSKVKYLQLKSELSVADAEKTNFDDNFLISFTPEVIHHSPSTSKIVDEVFRILKPGGEARIMIYHKWSIVGYILWLRYAFLKFKPWLSLDFIYSNYLESQGQKHILKDKQKDFFSNFSNISIDTVLTHADLLNSDVGQNIKDYF